MAVAKVEQVTPAVVTPDPSKQEEEYAVIGSNLANQFVFAIGDVEQGFREADVIVEREFRTVPVHQGYIEPHYATAY